MIQLAIDLTPRPALGRTDFLRSDCNAAALDWIDRWPDWPAPAVALYGPSGSGKTHLAHLWCAHAGADLIAAEAVAEIDPARLFGAGPRGVAIDEAERAAEAPLLHLYNSCVENGGSLLIIAREPPATWPIALADLASRLRALPTVGIAAPDDGLIAAVLVKHFADRQLRVAPEIIAYLLPRMERSFAAATALAARLDQLALSRGGAVTIPLARQVLAEERDQSSASDFAVT